MTNHNFHKVLTQDPCTKAAICANLVAGGIIHVGWLPTHPDSTSDLHPSLERVLLWERNYQLSFRPPANSNFIISPRKWVEKH